MHERGRCLRSGGTCGIVPGRALCFPVANLSTQAAIGAEDPLLQGSPARAMTLLELPLYPTVISLRFTL